MSGSAEAPFVDNGEGGDARGAAEFARQVALLGRAASAPPLGARGGKLRRQGRASAARAKNKTAAPINPASETRLRCVRDALGHTSHYGRKCNPPA